MHRSPLSEARAHLADGGEKIDRENTLKLIDRCPKTPVDTRYWIYP